ncbi:helix-turn-helix domain-containing protein [Streptomyces sp. NPDC006516]|uniref:ATP-binding protein n=1 Tax=Streptomyces sp. NPDC006516 TaxID=3154309 RepID=UPI0033B11AD6
MVAEESVKAGGEPEFGSTLRRLRLEASLTIEGLAEASGVSVRAIGDLERGRRVVPRPRTLAALAGGLGLSGPDSRPLFAAAREGRVDGYTPIGVQAVPRRMPEFVGRERELARLVQLAEEMSSGQVTDGLGAQPVIAAVSGLPGAGKTTLALHAARRMADHFPDDQVVVDMQGLNAEAPHAAELMTGVLRALRVPDKELVRVGAQGHIELYRQTLAERRFVLVLDNARDEAQVRPLLPSSGTGIVVVTSRRMLTDLEGVHRLPLDGFEPGEATALLSTFLDEERASTEAGELEKVAQYCGYLPLALRLAGSWLAAHRTWPVRRLAERLAPVDGRLQVLAAGDTRVSTAFDLSYRQLTAEAARLFRLLAVTPGPDVSSAGAARLSGQHLFDAEDILEELVETGLLGVAGDRYRLHDLLRLYAGKRLQAEEAPGDIEYARTALCEWLLRTTVVAGRWFEPGYGAPSSTSREDVDLSSAEKAREWLQAEGANWLAAFRGAAKAGDHAVVVEVAESLHWFSDQWIFWGHWPEIFATAASSAKALGNAVQQATQLNYSAWARLTCEGRCRDSLVHSAQALALAERAGDVSQQAWAYVYQAGAHRMLGEYAIAVDQLSLASHLFAEDGDIQGSLTTLNSMGQALSVSGRAEESLRAFQDALAFIDVEGDRLEENSVLAYLAGIHGGMAVAFEELGRKGEAISSLRKSVDLSRKNGNTGLESRHLTSMGRILLDVGRTAEARELFARVVSLGPYADPQVVREATAHLGSIGAVDAEREHLPAEQSVPL